MRVYFYIKCIMYVCTKLVTVTHVGVVVTTWTRLTCGAMTAATIKVTENLRKACNCSHAMANIMRFDDGVDVKAELAGLTMSEIMQAASDHSTFSRADKRSRGCLLQTVAGLNTTSQQAIRSFATRKRRGGLLEGSGMKKRPRFDSVSGGSTGGGEAQAGQATREQFLNTLDDAGMHSRIAAFIDRTGNDALAMGICVVCARERPENETTCVPLDCIPNHDLLCPPDEHKYRDLELVRGMLLYEDHYDVVDDYDMEDDLPGLGNASDNVSVKVCRECYADLGRGKLPMLALANGLWIGHTPMELAILTLPERILIARYFPAAYIVKLYPKKKNAYKWADDGKLNSGLKGNVSTFPLSVADTASMVRPAQMPQLPKILSATIGVTIVGPKNRPEKTMPGFLTVRRQRVRDALRWLKVHNPLYENIEISEEALEQLPEDAIPIELTSTTKYSDNTALLEKERSDYVPDDEAEILGDDTTNYCASGEAYV